MNLANFLNCAKKTFVVLFTLYFINKYGYAAQEWTKEARENYIFATLNSVLSTSVEKLTKARKYFNRSSGSMCRSSISGLRLQCMMKSMDQYCRKDKPTIKCLKYADLMIVNKLSEGRFMSQREKFALLKKKGSYAKSLMRSLLAKYAAVAMEFSLYPELTCFSTSESCFARGIDDFCTFYSDEGKLPWQSCVGAIIWFIGFTR